MERGNENGELEYKGFIYDWIASCDNDGCDWKKSYRNSVAAMYGLETHWQFCQRKEANVTVFKGKTDDAAAPILGSIFWTSKPKGFSLQGRIVRSFDTVNGPCYELKLSKPVTINGKEVSPEQPEKYTGDKVSVGNMKGFNMAVAASGIHKLQSNDIIKITFTGTTDTGKGNPRVNFDVEIDRRSSRDETPF